jgi:protein-tyrosine phosphatase
VIDLHCHILPELDDGAVDLDDAIAMARQAERDGIAVICATPHIRADHEVRIEELPARIAALQAELDGRQVKVRIAAGGEVAQTAVAGLTDEQLRAVCLDGARWVLLEPAPGPITHELLVVAARLAERGTQTIIAHPERHAGPEFLAHLRELIAAGCLMQWTADFVVHRDAGDAGTADDPGAWVLRMAADGLVQLLGSDAHSARGGRPVRLSGAFERLRAVCSPHYIDWMAEQAPAAILRGEPVVSPS